MSGCVRFSTGSGTPTSEGPESPPRQTRRRRWPLKKILDLLEELTGKDNVCIYALDETGIRLESVNFYSWGPKGMPCAIEAKGSHKGLNIVGATEILRDYRFYYSSHPSEEGMKAHHVGRFLDKLMSREQGKEVYIIWDNSPTHKAIAEEYESKYEGRLHLLFTPPYSPELDPQENIWCWLKAYCARNRAYSTVKELSAWIGKFQVYTYNTPSKVRKRVDVRIYFKAA